MHLACMGWQVLMATADNRTIAEREGPGVYSGLSARYVGSQKADLVVCNGGSATAYQALAVGTPVLGIPMNLDQYLMMDYIRRFGAGEMIRAGAVTAELVIRTVRRMVESGHYTSQAAYMRDQIGNFRTGEQFQAFVDGVMKMAKPLTLVPKGSWDDGLKNRG